MGLSHSKTSLTPEKRLTTSVAHTNWNSLVCPPPNMAATPSNFMQLTFGTTSQMKCGLQQIWPVSNPCCAHGQVIHANVLYAEVPNLPLTFVTTTSEILTCVYHVQEFYLIVCE